MELRSRLTKPFPYKRIFPDVERERENIAGTIYNSRPITRRRVKHACKIRVTNEIPRDSRPLIASTRRGYKLLQISSRGRDIWPLFAPLAAVHYHRNRQIRNSPTALFPRVIIGINAPWRKTTVCPRFPTGVKTPVVLFFFCPSSRPLERFREKGNIARNVSSSERERDDKGEIICDYNCCAISKNRSLGIAYRYR